MKLNIPFEAFNLHSFTTAGTHTSEVKAASLIQQTAEAIEGDELQQAL